LAATSGANRLPSVHGSSDKGMTTWGRGCVGILRSRRGAAVVRLLEVPPGVLADRWSRSRIMVLACVALLVSSTIGGLSQSVATYVVAAVALGGYFALSSGTVDGIVYDMVSEETESSELYETWIGRVGWWRAARSW
jgi:MFS family permease